MNEIVTVDGEVVETGIPVLLDDAMAGTIARAEIDMQIATAHRYPRSVKRAIDNILSLATLDEQTALSVYNGLDACVTFEIWESQHADLSTVAHGDAARLIYDFERAMQAPSFVMSRRGVLVD